DHAGPKRSSVLFEAEAFILERPNLLGHHAFVGRLAGVDILLRVEDRKVLADYLVRHVALDSLGTSVPARDVAFRIKHKDGVVANALDHELIDATTVLDGVGKTRVADWGDRSRNVRITGIRRL